MKTEPIFRVRFSTRGRVTIPAVLRRKFGVKNGSRMTFEITSSGAFLLKPIVDGRRGSRARLIRI